MLNRGVQGVVFRIDGFQDIYFIFAEMTDRYQYIIQKNAHRKGVKSQARTSFSVPTHYINTYNYSYPVPLVMKPLI